MESNNNKRLAKNTLFLYFRMFLTMMVSLYTSRIVLNTLGVEDYGIYNVVGGVVVLFAIFSATMANSAQRFLSLELANKEKSKNAHFVFGQFLVLHLLIAILVFLLAITLGRWFFFDKLNIPEDRINAALIVYYISVALFVIGILRTPYEACLIALENMKVYAFMGVFESIGKLLVAYLIVISKFDKLITYGVLTASVSFTVIIYNIAYVIKIYPEFRFKFFWDKKLFKSILTFTGWNYLTAVGDVVRMQGTNIILNIFFGPAVNAARGIAFQVQAALINFVRGFQTAVNPQLVKYWSLNEKVNMLELMTNSAKYSFYLLLIISVPIVFNSNYILHIWLIEPPGYTSIFLKLVLIQSLIESICNPMWNVVGAIGRLRASHIIGSILFLLIVLISYLLFKLGWAPTITFWVSIIIMFCVMIMLILRINYLVNGFLPLMLNQLVLKPILVLLPFIALYYLQTRYITTDSFLGLVVNSICLLLIGIILIWTIGITTKEKKKIISIIKRKLKWQQFYSI